MKNTAIPLRRVTFQVPMCEICNKEVDKFEMVRDGEKTTIVAYCHNSVSASKAFREDELDYLYSYRAFMDPKRKKDRGHLIKRPDLRELQGNWVGALEVTPRFPK